MHINAMNTSNYLKNSSICLRLFEKGEVELDQPDLDFFKNCIDSNRSAPDFLRTAAMNEIIAQTKEVEK